MTKTIDPRIAILAALVVVAILGGVYFLWSRGGSGPPPAPTDIHNGVRNAGDRPIARQARPDLPPGVPHLSIPAARR